jgi:small neutral amino acid transporter SnatA (MarC family)
MIEIKPPNSGPFSPAEWWTFISVSAFSAVAGFISWLRRVRRGESKATSFVECIGEIVICWFVGVMTYWILTGAGLNQSLSVGTACTLAHFGTRVLFVGEKWLKERGSKALDKVVGIEDK